MEIDNIILVDSMEDCKSCLFMLFVESCPDKNTYDRSKNKIAQRFDEFLKNGSEVIHKVSENPHLVSKIEQIICMHSLLE